MSSEPHDSHIAHQRKSKTTNLTVRLLVPRTGTWTTELLGLASPVVGNEQSAVVLNERLLQGVLGEFIDVFLVVGHDGLGDSLTDGIDLGCVTTASDAHADVDFGEALEAEEEDGLVNLGRFCVRCLSAQVCFCGISGCIARARRSCSVP
jgi:hypothetical protein